MHPSVGIVIARFSVIGVNLTLTGGNIIGGKAGCTYGDISIGDNCSLGANTLIIGASACVIKDCTINNSTLLRVLAVAISKL